MKKLPVLLLSLAALGIGVAVACTRSASSMSSPTAATAITLAATGGDPLSATVQFGRDDLGSPFPPPSGHDQSGHSRDSVFPAETVIGAGGTVTFVLGVSGVHEIALYAPGTRPEDIRTTPPFLDAPAATCPPVPTINDPLHRIAILSDQLCEGGAATVAHTFNEPGRYLVICTFLPHFQVGMYGWITVRGR